MLTAELQQQDFFTKCEDDLIGPERRKRSQTLHICFTFANLQMQQKTKILLSCPHTK